MIRWLRRLEGAERGREGEMEAEREGPAQCRKEWSEAGRGGLK